MSPADLAALAILLSLAVASLVSVTAAVLAGLLSVVVRRVKTR